MARPEFVLEGFDEFRTALRRANLSKDLGRVHKKIGTVLLVDAERNRSALMGEYPSMEKVRIKPSASARQLQIIVGPKQYGFAGEFGAKYHFIGGRMLEQQSMARRVWPPWSKGKGAGYLVFPALRERGDEIGELYRRSVAEQLKPAFPEGA